MALEKKYKIVVAHPSKQHSFYTAIALKNTGELYKYITTVYDKPGTATRFVKNCSKGALRKKIATHYCPELDDSEVIQYYELDYIISLFLNRFPKLSLVREKHRQYVSNKFGRKVAKYAIDNNVDVVIMYDSTATQCFKILKERAPSIKRVLDVSIATRPQMKKFFEDDMSATKDDTLKKEFPLFWNEEYMKSVYDEVLLATDFMVPSNVVKDSLIYCGAKESDIRIVPYGVDIEKFAYRERKILGSKLKLIYVGQVSYRKGIHHLMKIASDLQDYIEVDLVGSYSKTDKLYTDYSSLPNVKFSGFVTRDQLAEKYYESDAFVFPTLGEGYGLVVLEAMSCGLPVISSDHAGGNDAVEENINGHVFPAGDDEALKQILLKLYKNRSVTLEMGKNARKTAEKLTWNRYYKCYPEQLHDLVKKEK